MIQRVWDCVYHTDKYGTPFYHEFVFGDDIYHLVCRCTLRLSHLLITTMQLIRKVYSWRNLFGAGALDAFGHFFQNDPKFNKIKKRVEYAMRLTEEGRVFYRDHDRDTAQVSAL